MIRHLKFSFIAVFSLTSLINMAHASAPIAIETIFNAQTFNCTAEDDSLIMSLYLDHYENPTNESIQKVDEDQVKIGDKIITGVTSFVNTPKKEPYHIELKSLSFNAEIDGIKITRLAFIEGHDWAGYAFDIDGTDDKVQDFFDKYSLNSPEHPILDIHTTPEGLWRVECDVSGA